MLKKINETVYQEANASGDGSSNLKWRRSFNVVTLPLKHVKIVSNFQVHEFPLHVTHDQDLSPWSRIKPQIETYQFIQGIVDDKKVHDSILCAMTDKDDGNTKFEKPSGETELILKVGKPIEGDDRFSSGAYWGLCFRCDHQSDHLCFEMYLPEKHMEEILGRLRAEPRTQVEVGVYLLSFSYELDDAFGKVDDPRDLFIEDQAPAPVGFVKTSALVASKACTADDNENESQGQYSRFDLSTIIRPLGRLTFAMWVLIATLGLLLISRMG